MNNDKLVSVYITTKNRCEMLKRAVDSVLNQSYRFFEIIISDDGSTDNTSEYCLELIKSYNNIKLIRNEVSKGSCVARNMAIDLAVGEYITGLDDDDEFTPNRLLEFVSEWDPKYAFLCANFIEANDFTSFRYYWSFNDREFSLEDLLINNIASNQIFTLTERLKKIGGFTLDVKKFQDWDTWIKLSSEFGDFKRLGKPLYILHNEYRFSEKRVSITTSHLQGLEGIFNRNAHLYNEKNKAIILSKINYRKKSYSFFNCVYDLAKYHSILFVYRFLKQIL